MLQVETIINKCINQSIHAKIIKIPTITAAAVAEAVSFSVINSCLFNIHNATRNYYDPRFCGLFGILLFCMLIFCFFHIVSYFRILTKWRPRWWTANWRNHQERIEFTPKNQGFFKPWARLQLLVRGYSMRACIFGKYINFWTFQKFISWNVVAFKISEVTLAPEFVCTVT